MKWRMQNKQKKNFDKLVDKGERENKYWLIDEIVRKDFLVKKWLDYISPSKFHFPEKQKLYSIVCF